jgi:integrase
MSRPGQGPRLKLRTDATGSVFYICWTENGRPLRKSTGEKDPGRAEAVFADWLAERRRARISDRPGDPAEIRVVDVLADYAAEHGNEVASPQTIAYMVEPLQAFFAHDTMATLTTGRVKAYWTWRREHSVTTLPDNSTAVVKRGGKDGTIIRELAGTLRPAIKHAIAQKRLALGEYYIPVPQKPAGRDYWITRQEAARLLREARRDPQARLHLPLYVLIGLYTGQRRGAILDLTWSQVDLVSGIINFNPPGRQRTNKRRPIIPVPRSLLAALRRAHKRSSSPYVIAYKGEQIGSVKTAFNRAAERAGIPDCTSHTMRHTAGTWMAQRGVPLFQIGGYLGHSVARTTELYAHHHPDHLKAAKAAMERKA